MGRGKTGRRLRERWTGKKMDGQEMDEEGKGKEARRTPSHLSPLTSHLTSPPLRACKSLSKSLLLYCTVNRFEPARISFPSALSCNGS